MFSSRRDHRCFLGRVSDLMEDDLIAFLTPFQNKSGVAIGCSSKVFEIYKGYLKQKRVLNVYFTDEGVITKPSESYHSYARIPCTMCWGDTSECPSCDAEGHLLVSVEGGCTNCKGSGLTAGMSSLPTECNCVNHSVRVHAINQASDKDRNSELLHVPLEH